MPAKAHQTIFSANKHLLYNAAGTTKFGILVLKCSVTQFGSQNKFGYVYAVFPNENKEKYQQDVPKPELPANLKPYEEDLKRYKDNTSGLAERLTKEEFAKQNHVKYQIVNAGKYFNITSTTGTTPLDMLEGSEYLARVEEAALNSISYFIDSNQRNTLMSRLLIIMDIRDDRHSGSYKIGKQVVKYRATVNCNGGVANIGGEEGEGNGTGVFTVNYTEWLESEPEKTCSGTFTLTPEYTLMNNTVKNMIETMQWEGKEYLKEKQQQIAYELAKDYANYLCQFANVEKVSNIYTATVTVLDVGMSATNVNIGTPDAYLFSVYTDSGMLVVSESTNYGLPLGDVCSMAFKMELESSLGLLGM